LVSERFQSEYRLIERFQSWVNPGVYLNLYARQT